MKVLAVLSALLLILIAVPLDNASAKLHPDGFTDLTKPGGDEHPWGGEQQLIGDRPTLAYGQTNQFYTGNLLIDIFLIQFYYPGYGYDNAYQIGAQTNRSRVSPFPRKSQNNETIDTTIDSGNRGN